MPQRLVDNYTRNYGSADYTVEHYDLQLKIKLSSNLLEGTAVLQILALAPLDTVALNLTGLRITKALCNGRRLSTRKRGPQQLVKLPAALAAGERAELLIRYTGNPRAHNGLWGEIGWEELTDGVLVAGQPTGASTWFPCNDHPRHKSTYRFEVTTDAGYMAVCNGRFVDLLRSASRHTWIYEQREPMASYLATVQIGRYQELPLDDSGNLLAYAAPGLALRVRGAFSRQQDMAELFERCFGPYPFAQYKVVVADDELEIPLEAQGLSIFGTNHLSMEWEAQRLIAHEFSHQWFGNSLTLSSWKDIWLHEGFACFAEWLYSEASGSLDLHARAIEAWELLVAQAQDILVADPGAQDMFDDRVYKRGALTLYVLHQLLGADRFFSMMRAWTQQNQHSHVSTPAFLHHVQQYVPHSVVVTDVVYPWLFERALPAFPGS